MVTKNISSVNIPARNITLWQVQLVMEMNEEAYDVQEEERSWTYTLGHHDKEIPSELEQDVHEAMMNFRKSANKIEEAYAIGFYASNCGANFEFPLNFSSG